MIKLARKLPLAFQPVPRRRSEPVAPSGQHTMAVRGHDQTAVVDPHPSQAARPMVSIRDEVSASTTLSYGFAMFVLVKCMAERPMIHKGRGSALTTRHLSECEAQRRHRQHFVDRDSASD